MFSFTQLTPSSGPSARYIATFRQLVRIAVCMVNYQMLEGSAKIILPTRSDRSKTGILYIPADLVKDSSFPFGPDQEVVVRIVGKRLVVEGARS